MSKQSKLAKHPAFIPFIIAGHPDRQTCLAAVDVLAEAGADYLELGVPFSDALADGPVIQKASEQISLQFDSIGMTLSLAGEIHKKYPHIKIVIFSYFNPIFNLGYQVFSALAAKQGVWGVLVVDAPPEETVDFQKVLEKQNIKSIFLASPTTSVERFKSIEKASSGFVYYVSRTGVTGVQTQVSTTLQKELKKLRSLSDKPLVVGFGISNASQASQVAKLADGVAVGSAFVKILSEENHSQDEKLQNLKTLALEISQAIHSSRD